MVRPKCSPNIEFCPKVKSFKPEVKSDACAIQISNEEAEALRLKNIEELDQTTAAKKMGISQSTFQRILSSAYKKMTTALIEGRELQILEQRDHQ